MMSGNSERLSESAGLGEPIEVFKPSSANMIAGYVLSVLMLAGGGALIVHPLRAAHEMHWKLPFQVERGWCWLAVGIFCVIGAVLIAGGVALSLYCRWLLSHRVEVCANGFRYCSRRSEEEVSWNDVQGIQEIITYERPPVLKGAVKYLLPKVASTSFVVKTAGGKEYRFTVNSIKAIKEFGELLREQADRRSLTWKLVEQHV